jgi:hypothetical protein
MAGAMLTEEAKRRVFEAMAMDINFDDNDDDDGNDAEKEDCDYEDEDLFVQVNFGKDGKELRVGEGGVKPKESCPKKKGRKATVGNCSKNGMVDDQQIPGCSRGKGRWFVN